MIYQGTSEKIRDELVRGQEVRPIIRQAKSQHVYSISKLRIMSLFKGSTTSWILWGCHGWEV